VVTSLDISEVQAKLQGIVAALGPDDEVIIVQGRQPVAKLIGEAAHQHTSRIPGNCKEMISLLVEDDEHLNGFEKYSS